MDPEANDRHSLSQTSAEAEKEAKKPRSFYLIVAGLCICVFISTMNNTNFAVAVPAIASELKATTTQTYWSGAVLMVTQCISQPVYGAFIQIFGGRNCLLVALGIFALSSLLSALAQTIHWLTITRAVQGVGLGGINVCVNVISIDLVPQRERAKLNGIVSLPAAPGLVAGMLSGAALASKASWRGLVSFAFKSLLHQHTNMDFLL
jgi:MFS family permease